MAKLMNFKDTLLEDLKDVEYARKYLSVALEEYERDKDSISFLTALKDVAEARGGLSKLAKKVQLNRENLYKALSARGNPRLDTIELVLHGLGFRLDVQSIKKKAG